MVRWSWRMFRLEWRQQLLVLSLVTVAVAIAVAASTMTLNAVASSQPDFGTADSMARITVTDAQPASASIAATRSRFGTVEVIGHRAARIPGVSQPLDVRSQDPAGHFARSTLALRSGRFPTGSDEVALSSPVAALLDAKAGDDVRLDRRTFQVVGVVENPTVLEDHFALVAPDEGRSAQTLTLLFDRTAPPSANAGAPANAPEPTASIPVIGRATDGPVGALVLVAVSLAMTLVGLIAAAGFVVVAQRRQRQLGLVAAIGAGPRHVRVAVIANGAIVGLIATAAGTAFGIVGWVVAAPAVEQAVGRRIDRFDLPWGIIAATAAVAVAMATIAAWWPAQRISRMPVMAALSGRPPRPAPVHRSVLVALGLLAVGMAATFGATGPHDHVRPLLLIVGVIAIAVGTVFVAPAAIRVAASPAGRLPIASRLALRDLARFQARAAAALAAITFVVGLSATTVAISGANRYRADEGNLSDRQVLVQIQRPSEVQGGDTTLTTDQVAALDAQAARLASHISGSKVFALDVAHRPGSDSAADPGLREPISEARRVGANSWNQMGFPPIATPELLEHYGIDPASIDPSTDLITHDTRNVVLLDVADRARPQTKVQQVDLPAYTSAPRAMITEGALARHGWVRARSGWLVESPHRLTTRQIAAARSAAASAGLAIETRSTQDDLAQIRTITTAAGTLLALGIVAMTVGLIRSESARDLRTLTATGASSRTRRAITGTTAGTLALLGVVLGAGGAYVALVAGYHRDLGALLPLPWVQLATIAAGLPLLAGAIGWLVAGREPEAHSRQTFD